MIYVTPHIQKSPPTLHPYAQATIHLALFKSFTSFANLQGDPFAMGDTTEMDVSPPLAFIDNLGKSLSTGSKQDAAPRKKLRLAARHLGRSNARAR